MISHIDIHTLSIEELSNYINDMVFNLHSLNKEYEQLKISTKEKKTFFYFRNKKYSLYQANTILEEQKDIILDSIDKIQNNFNILKQKI